MSISYHDLQSLWVSLKQSKKLTTCFIVDADKQSLVVYQNHSLCRTYSISTAKNGLGNKAGSYQTPIGFHKIAEKRGENQPSNMLFKARQATGEIAEIDNENYVTKDSITSRILWLSGLEKDINLGGFVDTKERYIYIHGTADEAHLGQAVSHGCIRMKNSDVIELFQMVDDQTIVYIS